MRLLLYFLVNCPFCWYQRALLTCTIRLKALAIIRTLKSILVAIVQSSHNLFGSRTRAHKTPLGAHLQDVEHPGKVEEDGDAVDEDEGPSGAHTVEHEGEDCLGMIG